MEEAELITKGQRYSALDTLFLIVGIVVIGVVLTLILRVQRGLLGIFLASLVVILLVYWLREVRRIARAEWPRAKPRTPEWTYDLIESGDLATIVAEVPGPDEQVKADLEGMKLRIRGGDNFHKEVSLMETFELLSVSYNNGVLNVRLKRKPS